MNEILTPITRRSRVLVVDDTESVRLLFRKLLMTDGHDVVAAANGAAALDAVQRHRPDVVLLDVDMPEMDGLEVCRRLKADPGTRLTPVVMVTGQTDLNDRLRGIEAGADEFLSKPVHPQELRVRVRSLSRVKHLIDALDSAEAAFVTLALTIEARDPSTNGHCERLAQHAVRLGRALGVGDEDLDALHRGGYLHDVGKVGVPDSVLLKPGPLTAAEFDLMKKHPVIGDSLCAPLQSLRRVRPIVRGHHERLDGSGYPDRLRGDEVPMLAQIVGIVDVFDALTSERPYRTALTADAAGQYLVSEVAKGKFDRRFVDAFLDSLALVSVPTVHLRMAIVQMHPERNGRHTRTSPASRRLPALPVRVRDRFGEALIREHIMTPTALQTALDQCAKDGHPLYEAVVALGYAEERVAYALLAQAAGLEFDGRADVEASPLAIRLVPARVARLHELVPVAVDDKTIRFLTATPYDVDAERDVSFATGRSTVVTLACRSAVKAAIARLYPDAKPAHEKPDAAGPAAPADTATSSAPGSSTDNVIVTLCHGLLARSVEAQASDLLLDPVAGGGLVAQMRVAGVLETVTTVPPDLAAAVINRFKVLARVGTAVRNRPQEGAFTFQINGRRVDVRLSTVPTPAGEKLVVRAVDKERQLPALDALGYDADTLTRLTRALDQPSGLVLVTGPVASGKTTALYAALQYLQKQRTNLVSVEDPAECTLRGINQISVNARTGSTLISAFQSALTQQPQVLMVGELRDAEIAAMAWQAAQEGCLVLSSVRTLDSAAAVTHLLNLGLEPHRISECLKGILGLRLVRRLCPVCRDRERGATCERCRSTGYSGIAPLAELLTPSDAIQAAIVRGATMDIRRAMDAAGCPSIKDHAAMLVNAGVTSREEVARVLGADAVAAPPAPAPIRKSVLIADDEPITRTLVRLLLERDGYSVIEAQNGQEAVDLAVRHIPSLIVMDLNMPTMDGYEAISQIRRVNGLESTPIVVVTMEDSAKVADQVLALGADDYIMKPFEPSVLTARVKAAFRRQRLAA